MSNGFTIGIIGGTGEMGRWFEKFFTEAGHTVLVAGRKTEITHGDVAQQSDIVIISVPIGVDVEIAKQVGPMLKPDQLLMDFSSLKEDIVNAMYEHSKAEVIGTHPLFGPSTESIKGQNVALCPARGSKWLAFLEELLNNKGAVSTRMTPERHDRNMAVIQSLTHFLTVCLGRTMQKMDLTPDEARFCATPVFRINFDLVGRLFAQDLSMFSKIIGKNRHARDVLGIFKDAIDESKALLLTDNNGSGVEFMESIHGFLGDACEESLKSSNHIFNVLYENNKK
ncbi:MAG: prephenate dehydrogenase/arogenate dehydrogenase family protein [Desulfobacterales bacterium]|nr:prephenate dehydrogenase/arogenate dehydrogenase family protein [Desulfobacterales bacterium]